MLVKRVLGFPVPPGIGGSKGNGFRLTWTGRRGVITVIGIAVTGRGLAGRRLLILLHIQEREKGCGASGEA